MSLTSEYGDSVVPVTKGVGVREMERVSNGTDNPETVVVVSDRVEDGAIELT